MADTDLPTMPDGGYVRLASDTSLIWPVAIGHAWEHNCAGLDVFDNYGQVALPVTPEMLLSG
jgi:hypothetical protein